VVGKPTLANLRTQVLLGLGCIVAGAAVYTTGCATPAPPKNYRSFFLPPVPPQSSAQKIDSIEPPSVTIAFANESPVSITGVPGLARPSEVDLLIKRADDSFAAGKKALQEGRTDDARREFDRVVDVLLSAPENLADRQKLEQHLDRLIESIYRYDVDQLSMSQPESEPSFEKSPIDDILQMTFPIDPSLRNKVQEQIRATASQLPLQENDAVVSYINFFSSPRGRKILTYGLRRSGRYRQMILRTLREEGIPEELIYLAQAESGFTPRALSRAKCVGVWQFAAFRGREYGLNQTPAADDRMDPELSTRAAARHLHDLYNHFGDWYLAMAAYNCGPNCIDHAIERTGYADFWQLRRLNVLPRETANYVPAILAMTIMGKNAKAYGLDNVEMDSPIEYDTIELESATHLALIAEAIDLPVTELRELNPSLLRLVAPAGYALHVPKGSVPRVMEAFDRVPANRRDSWRIHRMETDDTFPSLAKRYGVAPALLSSANHDSVPDPGSWVVIPAPYPGDRPAVRARPAVVAKRTSATRSASRRSTTHSSIPSAQHKAARTRATSASKTPPTKASNAKAAANRAG
jgi:membrane-bound lytic murein transglycosylase D